MQPGCPGEAVIEVVENVHTLMCIRQLYIIDRGVLQASDLSPEFQNRYHQQKLSDYEMISRIPKFRHIHPCVHQAAIDAIDRGVLRASHACLDNSYIRMVFRIPMIGEKCF
ncbi:hypothetical protein Q3G72_007288 [Acer saccharum]|nr:hypothetical protein Q3G72_007288 [Acer saccharum]